MFCDSQLFPDRVKLRTDSEDCVDVLHVCEDREKNEDKKLVIFENDWFAVSAAR